MQNKRVKKEVYVNYEKEINMFAYMLVYDTSRLFRDKRKYGHE